MKRIKFYTFILLSILSSIWMDVKAQSINGDTIYVDTQAEIAVLFPNMPNQAYTIPLDAPYNFISFGTGFTIRAKAKNTKPVPWVVSEGKRTHHFIISYKRNINYDNQDETEYNYSSVKKLEEHLKQQEARNKEPIAKKVDIEESKSDNKKESKKDNTSFKYYSLLESGDQKFKILKYAEAKADFEKALAIKPDEAYPKKRMEEIKLKLSEKQKNEDVKLRQAYQSYIADGEKALKKNKTADARTAFEQALTIMPNDPVAKKNIAILEEKEKQQRQNDELETNYDNAVSAADKSFRNGDYSNAKIEYNKALGFIKKPWPQDQLNQIKKILADNASKEEADKLAAKQKEESDKKEKANQEQKKKYYAALKTADKQFADGDLAKAKLSYDKALEISNESWPKDQITKINKMLADQDLKEKTAKEKLAIKLENEKREKAAKELENKYNAAVQTADQLFKAAEYEKAKAAYRTAMEIIKKPWPQEQIKKADQLLAEIAAKEKAEKIRIEKEKQLTAKYTAVIQNADKEFAKPDYGKAKRLYLEAISIKADESYPKQKLKDIDASLERIAAAEKERKERLAAEEALKKKYDVALSKAKYYNLKDDPENALAAYKEAASLKPSEPEPQNQIKAITAKLAEIARVNAENQKYLDKIAVADSLMIAKEYEKAINSYQDALTVKPTETYPNSQIKYIRSEIKNSELEKENFAKNEAARLASEKEDHYHELVKQADKSMADQDFKKAKSLYAEALGLSPESDYAKSKLRIASYQYERTRSGSKDKNIAKNSESSKKDKNVTTTSDINVTPVVPQKQETSPYAFQANPIPYTAEELKAKYPEINFTALPPDQPYNEEAVDSKENTKMFNEVLTDLPRLNISDKDQKVKLICQGISFLDRAVYFKLLIQNNSDKDFLTGSMMLTWTRNLGNKIKLYPLYIYPAILPIVKPGNESVIIYVSKSYNIGNDEKLNFEMNDRLNKIKLQLNFKGSVYINESMR